MKGKMRGKIVAAIAAAALAASMMIIGPVQAFAQGVAWTAPTGDLSGKTAVIYTGNLHGDLDAYAKVATVKKAYQDAKANVVLVDTGNFYQGSTYAAATRGKAVAEAMKTVGYQVAVPGERDFRFGDGNLGTAMHKDLLAFGSLKDNLVAAEVAAVSSNIVGSNDYFAFESSVAVQVAEGTTIGFVGITDDAAFDNILGSSVAGLKLNSGTADAATQAAQLTAGGAKAVIALSNSDENAAVAGVVATINTPEAADEVMGAVVIDAAGAKESEQAIDPATVAADEGVAEAIKAQKAAIDGETGIIAVNSNVLFEGNQAAVRSGETNTGDLWTDALRWFVTDAASTSDAAAVLKEGLAENGVAYDHVVAIWNGGNLRDYLYPGALVRQDVERTLPYPNTVTIVYLTGAQLLETLESAYQALPYSAETDAANAAVLNISGASVKVYAGTEFDKGEAFGKSWYRAKSIKRTLVDSVGEKPFDANAIYAVICSNAVANGMDSNYVISDLNTEGVLKKTVSTTKVVEAVFAYMQANENLLAAEGPYAQVGNRLDLSTAKAEIATVTLSGASFVYSGKPCTPAVTAKDADGKALHEGADYQVTYANNTNASTATSAATVKVEGLGIFAGSSQTATFTIDKAKQPLTLKSASATVKSKKGGSVSIVAKNAQGKVTYTVAKKAKKFISVTKNGKVTVKKKASKGSYKITVKAAGNANYASGTKTFTVKVK